MAASSSSSSSTTTLALRPDEINNCIFPTGQPFFAVTSTQDKSRTSYLSSLNIKLLQEFEWNVFVGDIVIVSTTISNVVELQPQQEGQQQSGAPGGGSSSTTTTLKQYIQELQEWESDHYTKPAKHWRVGLVVALRSKLTRSSKTYECHVQYLDKAIDYSAPSPTSKTKSKPTSVWKNLQQHFRSYKAQQGNKGAHLPHILVNKPGEFDVISPLQLLPVKVTMLPQKYFVQHGVYTKDPSRSEERQFHLKFCCLKQQRHVVVSTSEGAIASGDDAASSTTISLVPEPFPDAWTKFNPPTEMHTESPLDEIPLPSPLEEAWKSWVQRQTQQKQQQPQQPSGQDEEEAMQQLRSALLRGWREARVNRYTAYLQAKAEEERQVEEERKRKEKHNQNKQQEEQVDDSTTTNKKTKGIIRKKDKQSTGKKKRKTSDQDDDDDVRKNKKKKKSISFATTEEDDDDDDNLTDNGQDGLSNDQPQKTKKKRKRGVSGPKSSSKSSLLSKSTKDGHDSSASMMILTDDTASETTHDTHSTDTTVPTRIGGGGCKRAGGKTNQLKKKTTTKKTSTAVTKKNKTQKKKKSASSTKSSKQSKKSTSKSDDESVSSSSSSSSDDEDMSEEWDVNPGHKFPLGTVGGNEYYASVSMTIQDAKNSLDSILDSSSVQRILKNGRNSATTPTAATFAVGVGNVVAIQCDSAKASSQGEERCGNEWSPFCVPWGIAQITSIYRPKKSSKTNSGDDDDDADDDDEWHVNIRWFYRFCELSKTRQNELVAGDSNDDDKSYQIYGIIETQEVSSCSLSSILPASVLLTSDTIEFESYREADGDLWPTIPFICRHFCQSLGGKANKHKIKLMDDWKFSYQDLDSSIPLEIEEIPSPLKRSIDKIRQSIRPLYIDWLKGKQSTQQEYDSSNLLSTEASFARSNSKNGDRFNSNSITSKVVATSDILYEQWGKKFYDSAKIEVDKKLFSKKKDVPTVIHWTLMVGHVVPVQFNERRTPKKNDMWLPFTQPWNPAQVVSVYQLDSGDWMMQIRWFYRFREIGEEHWDQLKYLDEPYTVFETEHFQHLPITAALPGRIVVMSLDNKKGWATQAGEKTGIPFIPRLCSQMCLDDEIRPVMDWSNYDVQLLRLPDPLRRGLELRPINRENKEWIPMLARYYAKSIEKRGVDIDIRTLERWTSSIIHERLMNGDEALVFRDDGVNMMPSARLEVTTNDGTTRHFYQSIEISTPTTFVAAPTAEMKRSKAQTFSFAAGDVVCYADGNVRNLRERAMIVDREKPWYPFLTPWTYGQVLSIYNDSNDSKGSNLKMEIRRFYRPTEIPSHSTSVFFDKEYSSKERIFESDKILDAVPVSHVLGIAELFLGHHQNSGSDQRQDLKSGSKTLISCRCKCFYFHEFQKLHPIYCSSLLPSGWNRCFLERGFSHSKLIRENPALIKISTAPISHAAQGDIRDMLSPQKKSTTKEGSCIELGKDVIISTSGKSIFTEISLRPQWSQFLATDRLFRFQESEDKGWVLRVGDIIAVKDSKHSDYDSHHFPYLVPWIPGRVLTLFVDGNDAKVGNAQIEIIPLRFGQADSRLELPLISDSGLRNPHIVESSQILGPLVVHFSTSGTVDETEIHNHIPTPEFWADRSLPSDFRQSLQKSSFYTQQDMSQLGKLFGSIGHNSSIKSYHSRDDETTQNPNHSPGDSWSTKNSFLSDSSSRRAFYRELNVMPLEVLETGSDKTSRQPIIIKMGDIVLVRFDGPKRYPYSCSWGVVEVVAIFKKVQPRTESEKENLPSFRKDTDDASYHVEVRWFYERKDVSAFSRMIDIQQTGELLETDHTQVVEAGSILQQAELVERPQDISSMCGVDQFVCRRFWSTTRKALVPINGLKGRERRSRLYSKCLPVWYAEDGLDGRHSSSQDHLIPHKEGWRDAISTLLGKLTLKDASKCAYKNGETLVGREREFDDLMKFFRSAIKGEAGADGIKSSITISGPPGTGKTASVRAAIARLQDEQARGQLPRFRFIPMNGMELRHPYDAYIRLWEGLVGRKHVGTYENAADKIREIFNAPASSSSDSVGSSAIVVLLDEIDYLITEKQSVLFDFFDYPKCAAGIAGGHRLVMVGVSNTLNLTDQLLPKVQSRVGSEKCIFKAYSLKDTVSILKAKTDEASLNYRFFEDDAILFAAKKTAALSGDIRKAFQICRGAAELVIQRFEKEEAETEEGAKQTTKDYPKVKISDVLKASQDSFNKALVTAVSFCTPFQALLLVSIASLARSTGRQAGGFDIKDILTKMEAISDTAGDPQYSPPPAFGETLELMNRLGEMNLIFMNTPHSSSTSYRASQGGSGGAWPLTTPAIDELTLLRGLKGTRHRQLAEKTIPSLF